MNPDTPLLRWIDAQHEPMCRLLERWASINSGSTNVTGLEACADAITIEFEALKVPVERIALPGTQPLGPLLRLSCRPDAPVRVLLNIHYDTVYPADHPFQQLVRLDANTLRGPGVADAKGGLVVLLFALRALEQSQVAAGIGWEVILNPDEEIGSPGSAPLLSEAARRADVGLLFEPAMPGGALVSARKGSGTWTVQCRGRAAHVGRNPEHGRNAIHAFADFVVAIRGLNDPQAGIVASVGWIDGGGPANVVPDRAACRFNVRVTTPAQQRNIEQRLAEIAAQFHHCDGIELSITGGFTAPPKVLDDPTRNLLESIAATGREIGLDLTWRDSGGASDGNRLSAAGLVNVDSMGVRGGGLHSSEEFVLLDSLTERAKLTALVLTKLARGQIPAPGRRMR